jgi:iron(III) transport system permease protein
MDWQYTLPKKPNRFAFRLRLSPGTWLTLTSLPLIFLLLLPVAYLFIRASEATADNLAYLGEPDTLDILFNSLKLALAVGLTSLLIGVPLAWLTVRTDLIGRNVWTILGTLPIVIPSYVGAFALIGAFGPGGILADILEAQLGIDAIPDIYGFAGAWLSISLFTFPYVFLSVRAGLRGLDPQLEAASRVLGQNPWTTFRRITLPQLLPAIQAGTLLAMLYALSDFGAVALMRYNAFTRVIYRKLFLQSEQAAALAIELLFVVLLLLFITTRFEGNARHYQQQTRRRATRIRLGYWQILAQLFCAIIVFVALVAPVGVILYWLVNGLQNEQTLNDVLVPMQRSMRVAALAALITGLAALPVVFARVRFPNRLNRLFGIGAYIGYALPGIVIALALVFFAIRFDSEFYPRLQSWLPFLPSDAEIGIYQTLPLLIFAYVVRFIPQMLGPLRTSLLQVNPHLEESARTLGRGPLRVFSTITAPLIRTGWVAGLALVFLTVMKELPATLLLAPTGYQTLATDIWSAMDESFYARAAAPSLVLLIVSALSLIYILEPDHD